MFVCKNYSYYLAPTCCTNQCDHNLSTVKLKHVENDGETLSEFTWEIGKHAYLCSKEYNSKIEMRRHTPHSSGSRITLCIRVEYSVCLRLSFLCTYDWKL